MLTSEQTTTWPQWSLLLIWITLSASGVGIGILAASILAFGVFPNGSFIAVSIVGGFVAGLIIGLAQWFLLRQLINEVGWWILATSVGSAIGSPLGAITQAIAGNFLTGMLSASLGSAMIGIIFGFLQWLILRKKFARASIWIVATAIGNAAGSVATKTLNLGPLGNFAGEIVHGLAFGLVTGLALIWLSQKSQREVLQEYV